MVGACFANIPKEDVAIFASHTNSVSILIEWWLQLKILAFKAFELHFSDALVNVEEPQPWIVRRDYYLLRVEEVDASNFSTQRKFASSIFAINFGWPIKSTKTITLIDIASPSR